MARILIGLSTIGVLLLASVSRGGDWPMWRYDAARSAASPHELPGPLAVAWTRQFAARQQVWDDPLNHDLMPYDRIFEPVVVGQRLFIGFNDRDKVTALDARTGRELWTFYADGPVRLPLAAWQDRLFFASDDGHLYCLDVADGQLLWRFRGGPSPRRVIGNQRVISAWPARGGPVVRDAKVYFAASIWPFMGTFIYALHAESGQVAWVNDRTGAQYHKQPHSAPGFAGVAPQGALVANQQSLIVPGGRSVPAVFDRETGELQYFEINAGGKGTGGSFVAANEAEFFVHTRRRGVRTFDLASGKKTAFLTNEPVLANNRIYAAEQHEGRHVVRGYDAASKDKLWEVEADGSGDLILAGSRLYAAGKSELCTIEVPGTAEQTAQVVGRLTLDGHVVRLVAASGMLFAVSLDGRIQAFGDRAETPREWADSIEPIVPTASSLTRARRLLEAGESQGYALWYGASDEKLIEAVLHESSFHLVVVDEDRARVDRLRRRFDQAGWYGKRVAVHHGTAQSFHAPPYVMHRVFIGSEWTRAVAQDTAQCKSIFESVRPYGGVLQLLAAGGQAVEIATLSQRWQLPGAEIQATDSAVVVRRAGPLAGAANWTHQYGDIANTVKSADARVKLPLGVLWFGGNSNMDVLPRHGHGPPEQVIGGRLFIQGVNSLSARDVYTGRVLWQRQFDDLGTFDVYYDTTYKNTPLDPRYNQVHIPGANGRGTNFVATKDRVYILEGAVCHVLDPASGEVMQDFRLPPDASSEPQEWGFIGVYEDVLLAGVGFANYRQQHDLSFSEEDSKLKRSAAGFGSKSLDRSASLAIVALDRTSGEPLWQVSARHSFLHNGIVAGNHRVYCLDKNPKVIEDRLRRRGLGNPATYRILALDYRTGEMIWQAEGGIFGSWLSYSEEHDLVLQAGASASDRLRSEVGQGMAVYRASDGSVAWRDDQRRYSGPCILYHDTIITNANSYKPSAGAFHLLDGTPVTIRNPVTGQTQPWKIQRSYGCNSIVASEHLLTFRSGAAGFYDLESFSGTGNLGGFRTGCSSNLIAADGVLNAPDYTRTCSCGYQNQTSLGLIHVPEMDVWAVNHTALDWQAGERVERMGINLGAPGDRRADNGVLWLEFPQEGGQAAPLQVAVQGAPRYFRRHSSTMANAPSPWTMASGVEGLSSIRVSLTAAIKPTEEPQQGKDVQQEAQEATRERPAPGEPRPYTVRLHFAGRPGDRIGHRVFDVLVQGETVLERFDILAETGDPADGLIKEFPAVMIADELEVSFRAHEGQATLSGIELQRIDDVE